MYLIKQVSEISGVSVRTLHHYDEIGLLSPKKQENGYRYYSDEELSQLQTILYYKYLGFSLKEIKSLMKQNEDDLLSHLKQQLSLMQKEKDRLLTLIDTLEK
ncbi:MAG: MerR family transcriptional regulator, partial [Streptococcus sp.]|nr:MerR family transcriptional regulator [Streptococcus sp.]